RSLLTGHGGARHGSIVIVSPSLKNRMCNWHTVVAGTGPCGLPLITRPHDPQIPSRQSLSNAIGSSPRRVRSSLTMSSISRKDISWLISLASYVTNCPGVFAFFCRQIRNVRFNAAPAENQPRRSEEHEGFSDLSSCSSFLRG